MFVSVVALQYTDEFNGPAGCTHIDHMELKKFCKT
jgi:hypothetical protein